MNDINVETRIKLNKFKPREFQKPLFDAVVNKGYKRVLCIWPRRAGKDICAFNLAVHLALFKVQTIFYVFPTYNSGRKILWDAITNDGFRILDYCPLEIADRNEQLMRLRFKNGSTLQVIGSNDYDTALVGTNAQFIIFSEYSLQDPRAYQYSRPILSANQGTALFLSTPRGRNHLFDLYQVASHSPDEWFCYKLTVDDTKHIDIADIRKEVELGELSEGMVNQEYYTSFDEGQDGYFFSSLIDKMRLDGRIGIVPHEPQFKVHTSWDLGINDPTVILFWQVVGATVHIIDYYSASNRAIDHFVNVVLNKGFTYGRHFPPFDIMVREQGSGLTRREMYKQLGINFSEVYKSDLLDGIEIAKASMAKIWIDETKCKELIRHLSNYRQEWDPVRKRYKAIPLHDDFSHACFTGDTLVLTRNGMRQIMLIEDNEEVLTLEGWKPCSKAQLTIKNAPLVEVKFGDGTKVRCTPEHLFLTTKGWKSASALTRNTKILSSLTQSLNTLMDLCSNYGQTRGMYLTAEEGYIDSFGRLLLAQYQKIATYITETMIPLTTISGISNVCQSQSILAFHDLLTKDLAIMLEKRPKNGTGQKKVQPGTKIEPFSRDLAQFTNELEESANFVLKSLMELCEQAQIVKDSVIQTAKPLVIAGVLKLEEKSDVWDITVPGIAHFSLSNGAIVHNSDAFRYMCVALKKASFEGSTPEQLDRRYREAMYGNNYNLPGMFR